MARAGRVSGNAVVASKSKQRTELSLITADTRMFDTSIPGPARTAVLPQQQQGQRGISGHGNVPGAPREQEPFTMHVRIPPGNLLYS